MHQDSKGQAKDKEGSGCSMIEKWAEKAFLCKMFIVEHAFLALLIAKRMNYAKFVNKSKKVEVFCSCLTFFHYLCSMFAKGCIVP